MRATTAGTTAGAGQAALIQRVIAGVVGGLAGGVIFGAMMQFMGMMGMIAQLVGSSSAAVGWVVHLAISAFFGAAFAVLLGGLLRGLGRAVLLGAVYGVLLWVVGPLLLMPAFLGMPLFAINDMALMSLLGHVIFGLVLGLVAGAMLRRRPA
ncbi:DUF6789 family protein [Geodermatophilus chilensis]|jgi:uncharacterized membrane protein YagU involved in acid resistance|uniref:DUF6789 family protein n=1 Tax=Geodermatophilus chilensis TaxID=2035835 RepID=UPI000C2581A8|nr:DUF6789 family protein [Geodermatophilus chilensis]